MKRKLFTIALAALFVVGAISIAISQGYGRRDREFLHEPGYDLRMGLGRGAKFGPCLGYGPGMANWTPAGINFTEEQLEKLQSLRTDFFEETLELRNQIQVKAMELRKLWTADELDDETILAKTREVSKLREQLQEKAIRHRLGVANVLTKEQRARFFYAVRSGRSFYQGRGPHGYGRGRRGRRGHFGMGRGPWGW